MHEAWPPWVWYVPAPHPGHEPVPAVPAPQAGHADLPLFTAQPDPDLHAVDVCAPLSCPVFDGHAPHTTLADAEHALVCFFPDPQVPQVLHEAWPPWFWY